MEGELERCWWRWWLEIRSRMSCQNRVIMTTPSDLAQTNCSGSCGWGSRRLLAVMTTSITGRHKPIHHEVSLTHRYFKQNNPQAWGGGVGIIYTTDNQLALMQDHPLCLYIQRRCIELHDGRSASATSETQGMLVFTSSHPSLMNLICLQSNLQEIFAGETWMFEGVRWGHTCVVRGNRVIMSYFDPINIHSFPFITSCYVSSTQRRRATQAGIMEVSVQAPCQWALNSVLTFIKRSWASFAFPTKVSDCRIRHHLIYYGLFPSAGAVREIFNNYYEFVFHIRSTNSPKRT